MNLTPGVQVVPTRSLKDTRAVRRGAPDPDLVASVKADGVLNPLVVRADGMILDGRLRWLAAKVVGLEAVPCRVLGATEEETLKADAMRSVFKIETDPVEYARQLKRVLDANPDLTRAALAGKLGKTEAWVDKVLSLLGD